MLLVVPLTAPRRLRRALAAALVAAVAGLLAATPAPAAPLLTAPATGAGCLGGAGLPDCAAAPSLDGATGIALSPDGRHAYVAARDAGALSILVRNGGGGLTAASCLAAAGGCAPGRALGGATGVDVSPDGRFVAVAAPWSDGVAVFRRDPASGLLTQPDGAAGCATETGDGGACLDGRALGGARDVSFSPDGGRLYVAAPSAHAVAILTLGADGIAGQAGGSAGCFSETGTGGQCGNGWSLVSPTAVAALPAGVLVTAAGSASLVRLTAGGTGALSQTWGAAGCIRDSGSSSCPGGRALTGAGDVAVTPDGTAALVAAPGADAVARIALGPALTQSPGAAGCISETGTGGQCADGRGLDGAGALALGRDGATAYVASATSDALAVLDVAPAALGQAADGSGCVADRATTGCATRRGLDGAAGVAVDGQARPVTAADTADTVLAFRPNGAPTCEPASATATWEQSVTLAAGCTDPDGDALAVRLVSVPRNAAVALDGDRVVVHPRRGEKATVRVGVAATDGALSSPTAYVTATFTAPPPVPPKPVPPLPAKLSAPLLGIERRPVDLRRPTTLLPTFCLPRATASCAATVEVRAGSRALMTANASGPGQVAFTLGTADRRAISRGLHRRRELSLVAPTGWGAAIRGASAAAAIELPVRRPLAGVRRTGGRGVDRLRGGPRDDRLSGRNANDRLTGLGGDDRLVGGGGNDRLSGGSGHDDLSGNFGNDRLDGSSGDDVLRGASGDDLLRGGDDADRLHGGTGNDRLDGGPGDDVLDGFDGDDVLRGGPGDDYIVESRFGDDKLLDGGPGDDYVDGYRGNDRMVRGGSGDDIVLGGPGGDTVEGGPGNDVVDGGAGEDEAVRGGEGDDVLVGGRGNDRLEGGPGNDVLYGSTGLDSFDCGPGEDWVHVDSSTEAKRAKGCEHVIEDDPTRDGAYDPVDLVANRGLARGGVQATKRGSALGDAPDPDRPIGTNGGDELVGGPGRDLITGRDGDDLIVGMGGNDDLDGGNDDDELRGGDGRDRLFGRFGDDDIHGEAGNDELEGGRGRDTLDGGPGNDKLNGGFDPDVLRGGQGNDRLIAVGGGVDWVDCGPGRDRADVDRRDIVRNCEDIRRH